MNGQPDDEILTESAMVSMALDPRFKSLRFISQPKKEIVHDYIVNLLEDTQVETQSAATVVVKREPDSSKCRLVELLKGDVIDLTAQTTRTTELELEAYLAESVTTAEPLIWWRAHRDQFPKLAKLAKQFLCIPATEVPSERAFSVAGQTVTKLLMRPSSSTRTSTEIF